jgi:hypothetical protein
VHKFICKTCGVQFPPSARPPDRCLICDDERQYIGYGGQEWTTLPEMVQEGYENLVRETDPGVYSVWTSPRFAIGQRILLVQTPHGNFMWDSISFVDGPSVDAVRELGGVHGICMSHPHFYASSVEWSEAFGGAPLYIPEADREYWVRTDAPVQWWSGTREVWPGLTLVQVGGHFDGSAVLHWADGAGGKGAIFTGDSISVVADRHWVTFMRSYPNYIPLPPPAVRGITEALAPFEFDRVYGGWFGNDVRENGKESVRRSAERYLRWTGGG